MANVCFCTACFPKLGARTTPRNAWCTAPPCSSSSSIQSIASLFVNLPGEIQLKIFGILTRVDIDQVRRTCRDAFTLSFQSETQAMRQCIFACPLRARKHNFNPMNMGKCSLCLKDSLSVCMLCSQCMQRKDETDKKFYDHLLHIWKQTDRQDRMLLTKKQVRIGTRHLREDESIFLFQLDEWL